MRAGVGAIDPGNLLPGAVLEIVGVNGFAEGHGGVPLFWFWVAGNRTQCACSCNPDRLAKSGVRTGPPKSTRLVRPAGAAEDTGRVYFG